MSQGKKINNIKITGECLIGAGVAIVKDKIGSENLKILMIANYVSFPWENGNCRFMYLINKLNNTNNEIELLTTRFCHNKKENRNLNDKNNLSFKLTLINEPGYKKNVCLKRLYSHKVLSLNLRKYLNTIKYKPDVIYCAIPSLDLAYEAIKYSKRNNIRFILDIQDLWPESFKMAVPLPIINDIIFFPMLIKENYIYKNADEVVAVSDTYINRALSKNKKEKNPISVYLGTDLTTFDESKYKNLKLYDDDYIRIVYIGTLGKSYNIELVIDAIALLNNKGIKNIKFIIIGDGPLKDRFENYSKLKKIDSEFIGRIEYEKMVGILCSCDIAVNPIVSNSVASIINKVGDYAAAALPVVNTQQSEEYKRLLEKYEAGFNVSNNNRFEMAFYLEKLILNKELRKKMGKNNRKLAEEKFNRSKTYDSIVKKIGEKL